MSAFYRKYATATHVYIPIVKRGVVDFAVGADWSPAAGDVKVSIDGGAVSNIGTLPSAIASGNTAFWDFTLSTGETTGKKISIIVADAATKAIEDQMFVVETYGHASAEYIADYSLANLPSNVVQVEGSALSTHASGMLPGDVRDIAGAAVSTTTAQLGVNVVQLGTTVQTGRDIGASVLLSAGTGTGQLDFTSGVVKANLVQILATALTETAGQIAAGFKKFFNVATPTGTVNSLPDAVAGASGGVFIAGTNAATVVTTSLTTTFTGNLTGNVNGNVVGNIGSLAAQAKADVNAEVLDVINVDTYTEPPQEAPGVNISLANKISYLYKFLRNKITQTTDTLAVYNDAGDTIDHKATVSNTSTTYTRGEINAGP